MRMKSIRNKLTPEQKKKRDLDMLKDFNKGDKVSDLTKKYNLSHTQVYKVMHELKEQGLDVMLD